MNIEDIKVGETYNVRMNVDSISDGFVDCLFVDGESCSITLEPERLHHPEPKYDPCRKFRKGDIVEPCQVNGRWSTCLWQDRAGIRYKVTKDEDPLQSHMEVKDPDSPQSFLVHAAFFKLVTPVEELEPYSVETCQYGYTVNKGELILATYNDETHPHAKEAAEAERDRLNAEYRKEQE